MMDYNLNVTDSANKAAYFASLKRICGFLGAFAGAFAQDKPSFGISTDQVRMTMIANLPRESG